MDWHSVSADAALRHLGSSGENGLSERQAKQRLEEHGENKLEDKKKSVAAAAVHRSVFRISALSFYSSPA